MVIAEASISPTGPFQDLQRKYLLFSFDCKYLFHKLFRMAWPPQVLTAWLARKLPKQQRRWAMVIVTITYAQPITGQVTEVTLPVIGWA